MASIRKLSQAKPSKAKNRLKKIRVQQTIFHSKFFQNVSKNIKTIKKYFKNTNDFFYLKNILFFDRLLQNPLFIRHFVTRRYLISQF